MLIPVLITAYFLIGAVVCVFYYKTNKEVLLGELGILFIAWPVVGILMAGEIKVKR